MPREMLAEAQLRAPTDDPNAVYASALNHASGVVTERWATGYPSPGPGTRLMNVHLHDKEGKLVGFRIYLVTQEPIRMGPAPVEIVE